MNRNEEKINEVKTVEFFKQYYRIIVLNKQKYKYTIINLRN